MDDVENTVNTDVNKTMTADGILDMIRAQTDEGEHDDFWRSSEELLLRACVGVLEARDDAVTYNSISTMLRDDIRALGAGADSPIAAEIAALGDAGREADARYRAFLALAVNETALSVEISLWQAIEKLAA